MSDTANEVLKIDVDAVLRDRVPRLHRYIPDALIHWLERFICQERMNSLLQANADRDGVDFARGILHDLGISYDTTGFLPPDSRVIIVSNHPLGGLDGLVLADFVASHYGRKDIGFVVNDLLNAVKPLQSIFLPINKFGKQSRTDARALDEAFASDRPIIMFPAGMVSRRNDAGLVRDLRWQKMVVNKALEYQRPIIPLHFDGENSTFFYKFARIRTKLGMKFNIEMICLPGEIFKAEGARFHLTIGEPILPSALRGGKEAREQADDLCLSVYRLVNQQWQ